MIACIIQARMTSKRLPGKILAPLAGVPVLLRVVNRVRQADSAQSVIVATSRESSDDPVEALCVEHNIHLYRGGLENVASRYKDVLLMHGFDSFVRISADSPFIDPGIIDRAVEIFVSGKFDMVTNTLKRTFPRGQSVQVIKRDTFIENYPAFSTEEQEHVLSYFQNRKGTCDVFNFTHEGEDLSDIDLSINEPGDLAWAGRVIEHLGRRADDASYTEIIKAYKHVKACV